MLPLRFWQPAPITFSWVLGNVLLLVFFFLSYRYYRKAKQYKKQLDALKHHSDDLDNIHTEPNTSTIDNTPTNNRAKEGDEAC